MNMKTIITAVTVTCSMALAGCANSDGPYGGHTEKWYEQHSKARHAEGDWCSKQSFSVQLHNTSCKRDGQASAVYYENPKHFKAKMNAQWAKAEANVEAAKTKS